MIEKQWFTYIHNRDHVMDICSGELFVSVYKEGHRYTACGPISNDDTCTDESSFTLEELLFTLDKNSDTPLYLEYDRQYPHYTSLREEVERILGDHESSL